MRRLFIFLILVVILAAMFRLSRIVQDWHYILPAELGQVLYVASFDGGDLSQDWEVYEGRLSSQIVDDRLRLYIDILGVESQGDSIFSAAPSYFRDFDVQVDAQVSSGVFDGNNNNTYGIIFRLLDNANYYAFQVSSDGTYRIKRVVNNDTRFISNWIESGAIRQEAGAVNVLRVVGYADRFQFYINDELQQLCIPDDPEALSTIFNGECLQGAFVETLQDDAVPYGRIAVAAELDRGQTEPLQVEFDNLTVIGPEPIE